MKLTFRTLFVQPATLAGALLMAILLAGALWLQYQQHGWPFATPILHNQTTSTSHSSDSAGRVTVSLNEQQQQLAGLQIEAARTEPIISSVRVVATVIPDERRIFHIHTRVAGWIEQQFVATTGESVQAGQPLLTIYSQDLYASQLEYLAVRRQAQTGLPSAVVAAARARLLQAGMTEAEIRAIEHSGQARRQVTVTAAKSGVVLRRAVSAGTAVDPSTELLTLADLSGLWIIAEVPQLNLPQIAMDLPVLLDIPAAQLVQTPARVDFVYPTLTERSRSIRVRFELANPQGNLKPGMYGTAEFQGPARQGITVPRDAIVDTGLTQHVFVATAQGQYEPRVVTPGVQMAGRTEILRGLTAGELVVTSGVFLLDSESRLRSGAGLSHAGHDQKAKKPEPKPAEPSHQGH